MGMPKVLVSVALATYNGERWLRDQLDSLSCQTLLPHELVVSDDHSADRTIKIVEEFAAHAPFPVRFIRNKTRLGFADNFINALKHCSGDAVAFCDQDDVWSCSKIEHCIATMRDHENVTLIHHDCEEVDSSLRPLGTILRPRDNPSRASLEGYSVLRISMLGCCMLLHRRAVDILVKYWPETHLQYVTQTGSRGVLGHDLVALHIASVLGQVVYLPEVLVKHRRHQQNTWSPGLSANGQPGSMDSSTTVDLLKDTAQLRVNTAWMYRQMSERAESSGDQSVAAYLTRIADRDAKLAQLFAGRAGLYSTTSLLNRLYQFLGMLRGGVYRATVSIPVGVRCALKDFLFVIAGSKAQAFFGAIRSKLRLEFYPREVMK
jgi:Glycosyl transferase family 2